LTLRASGAKGLQNQVEIVRTAYRPRIGDDCPNLFSTQHGRVLLKYLPLGAARTSTDDSIRASQPVHLCVVLKGKTGKAVDVPDVAGMLVLLHKLQHRAEFRGFHGVSHNFAH
jgi:hypothetical protein